MSTAHACRCFAVGSTARSRQGPACCRYKWDTLPSAQRPERGLLAIRAGLNAFANLRPAIVPPQVSTSMQHAAHTKWARQLVTSNMMLQHMAADFQASATQPAPNAEPLVPLPYPTPRSWLMLLP